MDNPKSISFAAEARFRAAGGATALATDGSYWNASAPAPDFPRLSGDIQVDVAVIGCGIVGVTTARMLKDRGQTVAVLEARRVGRQVTGQSTAKITSQHGLVYGTLERKFGEEGSRLYAEAQEGALRTILRLAAEHGIDCDLERRAAHVYTCDESRVPDLEREAEVARRLGLPAALTQETGLPFNVLAALRFNDQAQFHPTKYVTGLARTVAGNGSHVFEGSRAIDWEPTRVVTEHGSVSARHVVMATHLPLGQVGGYHARAFPQAEPVIAARIGRIPGGMYITVDQPHRSIRTHRTASGEVWAIAVGASFKPGQTDEERERFADLESWLAQHFEAEPVEHRWVNEDYWFMDGAPFVGWSSAKDGYLVATGFAGWGITNGTAAGMLLADLATGAENRWTEVFDARRVNPIAGGPTFVKENLGVAAHLVGGYLARKPQSVDDLSPGEAAILKIGDRNVAAYKDEGGQVHAVSAACSHMGCLLGWNATDHTWDCPCHGSRFSVDGTVVHGPAIRSLEPEAVD